MIVFADAVQHSHSEMVHMLENARTHLRHAEETHNAAQATVARSYVLRWERALGVSR